MRWCQAPDRRGTPSSPGGRRVFLAGAIGLPWTGTPSSRSADPRSCRGRAVASSPGCWRARCVQCTPAGCSGYNNASSALLAAGRNLWHELARATTDSAYDTVALSRSSGFPYERGAISPEQVAVAGRGPLMRRRDFLATGRRDGGAHVRPLRGLAAGADAATAQWQRDELALSFISASTPSPTANGRRHRVPPSSSPPPWTPGMGARGRAAGARGLVLTASTTTASASGRPPPRPLGARAHGGVAQAMSCGSSPRPAVPRGSGGLYLSPWDRNAPSYGDSPGTTTLLCQLTELLTRYGPLHEVWFDGAVEVGRGDGSRIRLGADLGLVRRFQPDAVVFSDAGPTCAGSQ